VFGAPPMGGIPMSGPAMMQNMQERLGDLPMEAGETPKPQNQTLSKQVKEATPASIISFRPANTAYTPELPAIQPSPTSKGNDEGELVTDTG